MQALLDGVDPRSDLSVTTPMQAKATPQEEVEGTIIALRHSPLPHVALQMV
jgi:hypothetical protein